MKKISLLFLALLVILSGCTKDSTEVPSPQVSPQAQKPARTVDISKGISENGMSFSHSFDFDLDGNPEDISMNVELTNNPDFPEAKLMISLGEYSGSLEMLDGTIDAVYACDINATDGHYDIAIITNEVSDDPRIRILEYEPELMPYVFETPPDEYGEGGTYQELWLGYAVSYYFNVNDDNTVTIEEQTPSRGMWSVYKTYKIEYRGLMEIPPERYEILPDFMARQLTYDAGMDADEKAMWEKGFIKAYTDYPDENVIIKAGEYIKPVYDDGKNKVLVKKENGDALWIDLELNLYDFNPHFFFLAG